MAVACPSLSASEALCPGMCVSTSPLRRLQASSGWVLPAPAPPPGPPSLDSPNGLPERKGSAGSGTEPHFPRAASSSARLRRGSFSSGHSPWRTKSRQPQGPVRWSRGSVCLRHPPGTAHPGPDRLMGPRWDAVLSLTCNFVIAKYKRPVDIANPLELPRHRAWLVFGYTCPPVGFKGVLCLTSTFAFEPF